MRLIKTIDDKIAELGFTKVEENFYGVIYERFNKKHNYTQVVNIFRKASGNHLLQSYDKDLMDERLVGNTCVGLTYEEICLFAKKFRHWQRKLWKLKGSVTK